ncbi:hypothetical protein RPK_06455 [Rickettsia rickettsii str. Hlp|nr:hypothetical protein RPK_06455 [Rickettsia rickettsii str. Hlp\
MATVGAAIGPVLGGVLVELLSWQFAFFNKNANCQLKSDDPLVDMHLFLISNFSIGVIVYLLITCVLGSIMYLMSLWLQFIKGLSPLYAGLYMLPAAVFALIASLVMSYLFTRFIARVIMFSRLIFTTI